MLEKLANSRTFLSFALATITGTVLFFRWPFPQANLYPQYAALKDPLVYSLILDGHDREPLLIHQEVSPEKRPALRQRFLARIRTLVPLTSSAMASVNSKGRPLQAL